MAEVELSPKQSEVFNWLNAGDPENPTSKNAVLAASRGFGKSILGSVCVMSALNDLISLPPQVPNKNVFIFAPTRDQVEDIYIPILRDMFGLEEYAVHINRSKLLYIFPRRVTLRLMSFEAAQRVRGVGMYFGLFDEMTSWIENNSNDKLAETFEGAIFPTMRTRWGASIAKAFGAPHAYRTLFISSPRGYDYFYDLYSRGERGEPGWRSWRASYKDSPFLSPEDIERDRASMDPMRFKREYLAEFSENSAAVFYAFSRERNVFNDKIELENDDIIHVGMDFNVGINATVYAVERDGQLLIFAEDSGAMNTDESCARIRNRFGDRRILVYPDPTGDSRKTSAPVGVTDFAILRKYGFTVLSPGSSPKVIDSVNLVNAWLLNAKGETKLKIHSSCHDTIRSLERTRWLNSNSDSLAISKAEGVEHWSDAVRYMVHYMAEPSRKVSVKRTAFF